MSGIDTLKKSKRWCQICRYHKNKPSMCYYTPEVVLHVSRKGTCKHWRIKKSK